MMQKNNKELSARTTTLFCVEGKSERYVLEYFCNHLKIGNFEVWEVDTKSSKSYEKELKLLQNEPHFGNIKQLALICDADDDIGHARRILSEALINTGLPAPSIDQEFAYNDTIRTGIFVTSGTSADGAIEELFLETLDDDPIAFHVDEYFSCLGEKGITLPQYLSKAKVQTYLAAGTRKKDLVCSVGLAARDGYWNFDHQKLDKLRNFLNNFK